MTALNALTLRREALERAGARLIDLTVTNPTAVGLSPRGVALPAIDVYEPEAQGSAPAREAVARLLGVAAERVVLSASTSEAYGWLFSLHGPRILIPAPCYPLLDDLAEREKVTLTRYPLRYEGRFETEISLSPLGERARVRGWSEAEPLRVEPTAVVTVSPGNPTGTRLNEREASELEQWCLDRNLPLIIDEVFESPETSLASRAWRCRAFILQGLSKTCGLPQLKAAWTVVCGPHPEAAVQALTHLADTYLSVTPHVQAALPSLLVGSSDFRARVAERCAENRKHLAARLPPDWSLCAADAGWSAVLRIPQATSEEQRCLEALERGVIIHPGYFYDFPFGAHLVLSLLPEPEVFAAGLARLLQ